TCERSDQGCWLLTSGDFESRGPDGFGWDYFETMSTDPPAPPEGVRAAHLDLELVEATRRFWDGHLPILPYVAGDYEYLAIVVDLGADDYGQVVHGYVIDFDSPTTIAPDYRNFLEQLSDVACREPTRSAVYDNYLTLLVHAEIIENGARPPWDRGPRAWLRRLLG
ncbi:MAG: hypothetical protein M3403_06920, partial [Gemmatimonadota bacterium]|nr:hypothetical protein [Gemmatimonadota bacterium]